MKDTGLAPVMTLAVLRCGLLVFARRCLLASGSGVLLVCRLPLLALGHLRCAFCVFHFFVNSAIRGIMNEGYGALPRS